MLRKYALFAFLFVLGAMYLTGCGGSSAAVSVSVTSSANTVDGTDSVTLTAVVANDHNAAGVTWTVSGGGTLSNTTTTSATYTAPAATASSQTITITATSVASNTVTATATLTVPAYPTIATTTALSGTVGTTYSAQLVASGGISPYTWSLASGSTLPAGLTMSAAGLITGTPTAAAGGTTNVTFNVKDSGSPNALTASTALAIAITPAPALSFAGTMPATATINTAYNGSANASGGAGTKTYTLVSGSLPTGTTLNASSGAVTGTLTAVGTFVFKIGVADQYGDSASNTYTVTVSYPAMTITTGSLLPTAYVNGNYSQTLAATGGTNVSSNYGWSLTGGTTLPAGLGLSAAGVISGKPTGSTGTTSFTVQVMDTVANVSTTQQFSITVNPGISITNTSPLGAGYVGSNYSVTLGATGGTGSGYTWALASGSALPAGLTLSSGGVIGGKPTATGTTSFTVTVTDSASNTASQTFSITVNAGISITSASALPKGYQGAVYPGFTFTATGGTGTGYNWTWAAAGGSSLPANLSLSLAGAVSGAPSTSGTFSIVVTVTDSQSNTASATVSLTIEAALAISPSTLPSGTVNVAYSQTLTATGGSGTGYTWASLANTNPALGITLTAAGVVTGTPTTTGSTTITAQVTDSESHTTSAQLTVSIYNALTVTTTSLPAGDQGVAYSQTLAAGGGTGSGYTWSATSSNLSSFGLSLSAAGVISGTPTQSGTASFTAKVTDSSNNTATQALSILVYSGLSLPAGNSLPAGYTNVAYNGAVVGSGGSGNLSIAVTTALSPANGTLATSITGTTVNVTGTPTTATAESFSVKLTDTTTSNSISQTYSITISTASAPVIPSSNPNTLPSGTVNQSYSGTISASGGVGPNYTWKVNGTSVPTNGSAVALSDGLSVSNNGTNVLSVGGTPTAVTPQGSPVSFTATVTDSTTSLTSTQQTYTVQVNSAGSQVSGRIAMANVCGNTSQIPPTITLTLLNGTTQVQQVQTDNNGNFSFSGVANGTYTVSPSISGPKSVFAPLTQSVTVNNGNVTGVNFAATLGYTVSGSVSYSGAHTGQIYINLINSNCGGSGGSGTSISSPGSYTINGVSPGSYTVWVWQDSTDLGLGQGFPNTVDPTGSSSITVSTANYTGANVTLANNDPSSAPTSTPTLSGIFGMHNGVVISYKPANTSVTVAGATYNEEQATSYDVAWSTSSALSGGSLATIAGTQNFKAIGKGTVLILNNGVTGASSFTDGQTYYFQARARNGSGAGTWKVYGGGTPTGVTVNPPSGADTISGNVTIPIGITVASGAKLYVGVFSQSNGIYATAVNSPVVGSSNPFTVNVPSGTWQFFGILDQNNDGEIDAGDVSNTRNGQGGPPTINITASGTQNLTLPSANVVSVVQTQYQQNTYNGGSYTYYALNIGGGAGNKLPVAMTITGATNPNVITPFDISNYCQGCGSAQFQAIQTVGTNTVGLGNTSNTPAVGDTYTFTVKYSDGSTDTSVTAAVTAFGSTGAIAGPSQIVTNLLPSGTTGPTAGTRTQPTITWTYPTGASTSGYSYSFQICCGTNGDVWDIPSNNSNQNGFSYSQIPGASITWGTDPTTSGSNAPNPASLTVGTSYTLGVTAVDSNGNQAQNVTWYQP